MKISWNGFSKKSYQERLELLKAQALLSPERQESLEQDEQMSVTVADQLSENVVGTFSLPYSLVPEVLVNGQEYTVPYVTEEPSVVAAASYASKIIKRAGGFTAQVHERQMIGQVALYQVDDPDIVQEKISSKKAELLELANQAYPSIVKRGGGARDLHVEQIKGETDFLVVYLHVDTQEAMGANMLNTMLEALKPVLEELSQGQSLMGILSNYATDSLVTASCRIAFRYLSRQKDQGREIAEKIALASQFAQADPYRAATHNKGIFNGIDAVLIETIFDTLNAKVAIDASLSEMKKADVNLPIMLSVTITDLSGRTLSGQTLDAFLASVSSYPIFSVGLNCSFGAEQMRPYLKELAAKAPYYISIHPNAGLPNSMGEYDETPEIMVPQMASFVNEGLVNIIGGCCGTTEEFIAGYVKVVEGKKPHIPVDAPKEMILSGLEQFRLTPEISFVNVGERCNVAGSRKFLRLVKEKNYEEALTIARKQVDDGVTRFSCLSLPSS